MRQTRDALERIARLLPGLRFEERAFSTPGDRDQRTDLRASPSDFFTRDLDEAVLSGALDAALHSAKDLPDPIPAGLDWCWLPWREDPRDVLVLRRGLTAPPERPVIGVSSERRDAYCRARFPGSTRTAVRGAIEDRIRQLDEGRFDLLVMAAAGLARLGLADRIFSWIPLSDLPPPAGQGALALTFRQADPRWLRIRSLFVKPVVFAGGGGGDAGTCTLAARAALERCEVCFYDTLLDSALLDFLPEQARRVDVGKRCGDHSVPQPEINALLTEAARRGERVVRLKGGDPGLFGRLAEEIEALDALRLPYRVIPGVSSLAAATTGTGMLLTRRGVSRGFSVITPRQKDGGVGSVRADERAKLPLVFFMGIAVIREIVGQLLADGLPATTPAAVVFEAGAPGETVLRGTLDDIAAKVDQAAPDRAGLIIVGSVVGYGYHPEWGALMGRRILLPCSEALQKTAADTVLDFGGIPVSLPLIRMVPEPASLPVLQTLRTFDGVVVTSPSCAHLLANRLAEAGMDVRAAPKILVSGPGTAAALRAHGLMADAVPREEFGADGVAGTVRDLFSDGARLLRVRSQLAGPGLADRLREKGFRVTDCVLYDNEALRPERVPSFDAVFFASASAVNAFFSLQPVPGLDGKHVMAIGKPTLAALEKQHVRAVKIGLEATAPSAIETLAALMVQEEIGC